MYTYRIFGDNNQEQHHQPNPMQQIPVSKESADEFAKANTRNVNAMADINEANARLARAQAASAEAAVKMNQAQILLNGMAELRLALHIPTVDPVQSGVGEATKLLPMFDNDQVEALRLHYLNAFQKYETFANEVIDGFRGKIKE